MSVWFTGQINTNSISNYDCLRTLWGNFGRNFCFDTIIKYRYELSTVRQSQPSRFFPFRWPCEPHPKPMPLKGASSGRRQGCLEEWHVGKNGVEEFARNVQRRTFCHTRRTDVWGGRTDEHDWSYGSACYSYGSKCGRTCKKKYITQIHVFHMDQKPTHASRNEAKIRWWFQWAQDCCTCVRAGDQKCRHTLIDATIYMESLPALPPSHSPFSGSYKSVRFVIILFELSSDLHTSYVTVKPCVKHNENM